MAKHCLKEDLEALPPKKMMVDIPLIADPQLIAELIKNPLEQNIAIIDVGKEGIYTQAHLPNAVHINYLRLQQGTLPAPGLPPSDEQLEQLFSELGLTPNTLVVAYDDEGGTRAARLLWLLELAGHQYYCYLNGGIHAWLACDLPYSTESHYRTGTHFRIQKRNQHAIISMQEVLERLTTPNTVVWDARSREEYDGIRISSARAGHIPGAVNYEWSRAIDLSNNNLLRSENDIRNELHALGITPEKNVIVHCQTHHRSSFAWLLARHLGYNDVRGYAGSWAEWGNHPDTPITS